MTCNFYSFSCLLNTVLPVHFNPSTATTSPQTTGTLFNNQNRMTG
nr:MAG TPA: hypothetical protein [Caudoviricetes sp.]